MRPGRARPSSVSATRAAAEVEPMPAAAQSTSPRTASGRSAAARRATSQPSEWPIQTALASRSASASASTASASGSTSSSRASGCERPWPGRSGTRTRRPPASGGARARQFSIVPPSLCTSTSGTAPSSGPPTAYASRAPRQWSSRSSKPSSRLAAVTADAYSSRRWIAARGGPSEARHDDKRGHGLARQRDRRDGLFRTREGVERDGEPPHARRTVQGARPRPAGGDPRLHGGRGAHLPGQDRQASLPGPAPSAGREAVAALRLRPQAGFFALAAFAPCRERPVGEPAFGGRAEEAAARRPCASATLRRSASIRSTTGVSATGSGATISRPASFASSICARSRRYSFSNSSGTRSPARLAHLGSGDRLLDLALRPHVLGEEQRLEQQRALARPDQAEVLLAPEDERADRCHSRFLHRPQEQDVRPPLRLGAGGCQVVRAVEVDRVDVLQPHEAADLDRLRALAGDRLEVGVLDGHVLSFRELPASDELLGADLALVHGAPPLLLDRRAALAVQRAERDVLPLGGDGQSDRDVDQAEADRSVPDGAHGLLQSSGGASGFLRCACFPAQYDSTHGAADGARALARRRPEGAAGARVPGGAAGRLATGRLAGGGRARRGARAGLLARGVRHGDRVAILARTRLEWVLLDWAVMAIGAVVVGLYPTSSAKECEYVLGHCEAVLAFSEDEEQTRKVVSVRGSLPALREVVPFERLEQLEAEGRLARHLEPQPVDETDLATLIYTSGTTGPPKGCMLTHRNLVAAATAVREELQQPGDVVLLFLPLAHSYGRLAHQAAARRGATVAFVADAARVPDALAAVRPTILPAVPRVYEKIHAAVLAEIERAGGLRRRLGRRALAVGARASSAR